MTEKEVNQLIKLYKNQLELAELYKEDFIETLGVIGYSDFIDETLERLKTLMGLRKKIRNAKNKN